VGEGKGESDAVNRIKVEGICTYVYTDRYI
jgi:hypothetical protein